MIVDKLRRVLSKETTLDFSFPLPCDTDSPLSSKHKSSSAEFVDDADDENEEDNEQAALGFDASQQNVNDFFSSCWQYHVYKKLFKIQGLAP